MSEENVVDPAQDVTPPASDADAAAEQVTPRLDSAQLKAIVEALVFASPEPLTPKMLFKLLNDEPKEDVLAAVKSLQQDYEHRGGLHLAEVAGGYQITTRPELHDWVVCSTSARRRNCRCSRSRLWR
jgi:chromosome segregation and condensation protein ScpB